jgi:type 1 glutamine amidotransferase
MTLRRLFRSGSFRSGCAATWIALAVFALSTTPATRANDEGDFQPLFNGQDLSGWEGNPQLWSVRDGIVTGQTTADHPIKENTFLIWRGGEVADFELRLTYRITAGNSGIQYRSKDLGNWVVGGYQADFEAGDTYSGILYEERGRGILAKRGEKATIAADGAKQDETVADTKQLQASIKKNDWNDYVIIAEGNHLIHMINGKVTAEVIDQQKDKSARSGILALQLHAGPPMKVEFKNVRMRQKKVASRAKRIVLVAGTPSHPPLAHEFNAGAILLGKCLQKVPGVEPIVHLNGWPKEDDAFEGADAIMLYMDGGANHPLIRGDNLAQIGKLMKQGVGLLCVHYAVEIPADKGGPELLKWIGGYYERGFSINPHWVADFKTLPEHPITRGVKPFAINDEWYFNMRWRSEEPAGVTPILIAAPPDERRGTPAAKAHPGRPEIVAWAAERPDGGRGFGFTGGHNHMNWGDLYFRTLILNALVWAAHGDVPPEGIQSMLSADELNQNLDPKPQRQPRRNVPKAAAPAKS